MTRQEIEQRMDESAREFVETYDPEIREEIYRLARMLIELDHLMESGFGPPAPSRFHFGLCTSHQFSRSPSFHVEEFVHCELLDSTKETRISYIFVSSIRLLKLSLRG